MSAAEPPGRLACALKQGLRLVSPAAAVAARVALERNTGDRLRRLTAAARDRAGQRRRPTRARMRAIAVGPGGSVDWREVPSPPDPGPRGALVRPVAAATCDLDRPLVLGATMFPPPLHLGHECVAEVLAVGDAVTEVRVGQLVVVPFQISCGTCGPCTAGRTGNCTTVPPISMYGFGLAGGHWGGAFSEQLAVPYADAMLVPLPAGVDPVAAASVSDTICDGYRHIGPHLPRLLAADPDTEVLVVGSLAGASLFSPSLALYAGLVALALAAPRVHLVDARPAVREQAARLGLRPLGPSGLRALRPAGLVVDASTTPRGLRAALAKTAPDGVCSSAGTLHRSARIPLLAMYGRNVTLHIGRTHARVLIPHVLDLMATGRLHPENVITRTASFDDAPRALREHVHSRDTKTVLTAE
jgi:alcohol dehydrogenase